MGVLFLALDMVFKPLLQDSFMQWYFNFLTAINLLVIICVLSDGNTTVPAFSATTVPAGR